MSGLFGLARPLLFAMDAEQAHGITIKMLKPANRLPFNLVSSDARVLAVINAVLPSGVRSLTALHELFSGTGKFFLGMPETDPYSARADALYFGVYGRSTGTAVPSWPDSETARSARTPS